MACLICLAAMTVVLLATVANAADPSPLFTAANFTGVAAARKGRPDNVLYDAGYGSIDFRGKEAMPKDAHFPIASNTKVYVAIGLYQLQERGLVDLSRNIQDYLESSDFAAFGVPQMTKYCPVLPGSTVCQNITFVQLLNMQACLPDTEFQFLPYPGSLGLVFGRYIYLPLACEPGTQYYYSNPAFMLGAYFVEKFSGMRWRDYNDRYIHTPLGQKHTYFDPYNGQLQSDSLRVDEWFEVLNTADTELLGKGRCYDEFDLGSASGAGGIISTTADEALLYFTLFNFSEGATGAPLFQNLSTVRELVRPRTNIGPFWLNSSLTQFYAQGLFVVAERMCAEIPWYIVYEGAIMCSHTSNTFRVAQYDWTTGKEAMPAMMSQVWSAVRVAYTTPAAYNLATNLPNTSMIATFNNWGQRPSLQGLSWQLMEMYA
jgi:CubicO group peptidase (beta-lactamase class C family)